MEAKESIRITALRADGTPYRWWDALVEQVSPERIVTYMRFGEWAHEPDGGWPAKHHYRFYYWPDRPFNLVECFTAAGDPAHLYVHIASPFTVVAGGLQYHDYELDVVKRIGQVPEVRDQDEFKAAAVRYGYSSSFQSECWSAVRQAQELVSRWVWSALKSEVPS
ncbi:MAG: DUF402 domain-containing protein [Mycobacterium leprae]